MSDLPTKFRDALGAADSYLHSLNMMVETAFNGQGKNYCAFNLVIEAAQKEISEAHALVDEMER